MKYYMILALLIWATKVTAQQNYGQLTQQALEAMWEAKDDSGYKKALKMYEDAFEMYPDSIEATALYKSSVLSANLKLYDKAFNYLTPLALKTYEKDGYTGWTHIVGKYAAYEYKNLLDDPRWVDLEQIASKNKVAFYQDLQEKENEFYNIDKTVIGGKHTVEELYVKLKNHHPYLPKKSQDYSLSFTINDSTKTSFFVHLPQNYDANKRYPVLFFLHGAVHHNALSDYQLPHWNLGGWNRYYTKYAELNQVILVFPKASKQYNWMTSDDGFFMIPQMLKLLKKGLNIDDNKVFISGHSNGATGSFSYWMKQPSQFAGFYGFNTYPMVFTGGTFVENSKNRSFINFSTDQDYYYPPNANDDFTKLMDSINADYKEYRYLGYPHWFPEFDASEPAYQLLFEDLVKRERDPFVKEISWELDDQRNGTIDWISDIKLDTLQPKKSWHKELNFNITQWLEYYKFEDQDKDSLIVKQVDLKAFKFPRKSGKIKAKFHNNTFNIETSGIKSLTINLSPEMAQMNKKIKVYINGRLYFNQKVAYNREFMIQNFEQNRDRKQIWVNQIELQL